MDNLVHQKFFNVTMVPNEFKGKVLLNVEYHGISLIRGSPRHLQIQGLIEQGNAVLMQKI